MVKIGIPTRACDDTSMSLPPPGACDIPRLEVTSTMELSAYYYHFLLVCCSCCPLWSDKIHACCTLCSIARQPSFEARFSKTSIIPRDQQLTMELLTTSTVNF